MVRELKLPVIDDKVFHELQDVMGPELDDLIANFTEDTFVQLQQLRLQFALGEESEILDTLKVLRASSVDYGLFAFSDACQHVEEDIALGEISPIDAVACLESEFDKVLEDLPTHRSDSRRY